MNNNQIGKWVEATAKSLLKDSKYSDEFVDINISDEGVMFILFKNKKRIEAIYLEDYDEFLNKKTAVLSAVLTKIVSVIEEV